MKLKPGLYWNNGKQRYFTGARAGGEEFNPATKKMEETFILQDVNGNLVTVFKDAIRRFPEQEKGDK